VDVVFVGPLTTSSHSPENYNTAVRGYARSHTCYTYNTFEWIVYSCAAVTYRERSAEHGRFGVSKSLFLIMRKIAIGFEASQWYSQSRISQIETVQVLIVIRHDYEL
jgi:hypothetical protein